MPRLLMMFSLRFGLLGAALLAACSIGVEQSDTGEGQDAECLLLFETCVDLAGESPGCTEVFEFCLGSIEATGTGGGFVPGSCEQNYIDCLAGGSTADECQPLLDACMPSGSTSGCDPLEPSCGMLGDADTSAGGDDETGCSPDDPSCTGTDCDPRYDDCLSTLENEDACRSMRDACLVGDCETAIAVCAKYTPDSSTCSELTGCGFDERPSCDELLADCEGQGVPPSDCGRIYPERADCFPDPDGCQWYDEQCYEQFELSFCEEARGGCEVGILPQVFDCLYIEGACEPAGLTESACSQAQQSCQGGFFDIENCSQTPLAMDPYLWLNELAACNGWM